MRARHRDPSGMARLLAFAPVVTASLVAVPHIHAPASRIEPHHGASPVVSDRLADEMKRCQPIAIEAKDDAECEAAWADNRRLFSKTPTGSSR